MLFRRVINGKVALLGVYVEDGTMYGHMKVMRALLHEIAEMVEIDTPELAKIFLGVHIHRVRTE